MINGFKINGKAVSHREFCSRVFTPIPQRKGFLKKIWRGAGVDLIYIRRSGA